MIYKEETHDNGNLSVQKWFDDDNMLHSINDDPAAKLYYSNGEIETKIWMNHGKMHRDNNPTIQSYHKNGTLKYEEWFWRDRLHREDGRAFLQFDKYGHFSDGCWALDGDRFEVKDEYDEIMKLANDIRKDPKLALLNTKHELRFIRRISSEVLNGK